MAAAIEQELIDAETSPIARESRPVERPRKPRCCSLWSRPICFTHTLLAALPMRMIRRIIGDWRYWQCFYCSHGNYSLLSSKSHRTITVILRSTPPQILQRQEFRSYRVRPVEVRSIDCARAETLIQSANQTVKATMAPAPVVAAVGVGTNNEWALRIPTSKEQSGPLQTQTGSLCVAQ
ncbi:hypothetical protein BO86DRAFT_89908 [Aspergillus japonicus CBS 114.51]|uniref:Uncharacterized protein n=2 Tax=Aspergillus TaxID=5052 RepID=A0A2V5I1X5_ASPV1|nr:hypothetical protein BO86DRAFT_89908 [Aspergillus japonicus CBS 114.51]PYI18107.1 hypothetical protein BO99DRAFT_175818 [Aspergillus violaceofuscus CBS 115571]RAH81864.1 hypothetical protein BO86DRAFT_89908 [Aspergillus japonicus CBS 114.51]